MNATLSNEQITPSTEMIKLSRAYYFASPALIQEFCKVASMDRPMGDVEEMLSQLESNYLAKQGGRHESTGEVAV